MAQERIYIGKIRTCPLYPPPHGWLCLGTDAEPTRSLLDTLETSPLVLQEESTTKFFIRLSL